MLACPGVARGKPTLRFTLRKGTNAPKLKSFRASLPAGLSFVSRGLAKGVSVPGRHTSRLAHGKLIVTLKRSVSGMIVRLSSVALHENGAFRRHDDKRVRLRISVTDAAGTTTALTAS